MKQVGIRELKARLSEFVREAGRGEFIEVTDRGKVVAELRPPGTSSVEAIADLRFRQMVREGRIIPASRPPRAGLFQPVKAPFPPGTAAELLDLTRDDRHLP